MTPTTARLDDVRQRLAALRTGFAEVGARAAAAAAEVRASAAPAQALLDDLRETSADFDELRVALLEEANAFAGAPDPARIRTLKALGALVSALERVEAERARRTAWEAARENALGVLDRVVTLIHREDKDASALADCQAKARELHAALSAAEPLRGRGGGALPQGGGVSPPRGGGGRRAEARGPGGPGPWSRPPRSSSPRRGGSCPAGARRSSRVAVSPRRAPRSWSR